MGWLDRIRGRGNVGLQTGPASDASADKEFPFFRDDLSRFRWAAEQKALEVSRAGFDPTRWEAGQVAFPYERALAHDHEGLRDRLSSLVAKRLREGAERLYPKMRAVALQRTKLQEADDLMAEASRRFNEAQEEIQGALHSINRYQRMRNPLVQAFKWLLAGLFIFGEGALTVSIFIIGGASIALLLTLSQLFLLVAVPHLIAFGFKEAGTTHHAYEIRAAEEESERTGLPVPWSVQVRHRMEQYDDKGFRWIAIASSVGLIAFMVPLTVLRADALIRDYGVSDDLAWAWYGMVFVLQLLISGYFFFREWLDHDHLAADLHAAHKQLATQTRLRNRQFRRLAKRMESFHTEAERLIEVVREAPRWDSYIVSSYHATVDWARQLISSEHPNLGAFVFWARRPVLAGDESSDSEHTLDPTGDEHATLLADGPMGRVWLPRTMLDHLVIPDDVSLEEHSDLEPQALDWVLAKNPHDMLREFLDRYFDFDLPYEEPDDLDREPDQPLRSFPTGGGGATGTK